MSSETEREFIEERVFDLGYDTKTQAESEVQCDRALENLDRMLAAPSAEEPRLPGIFNQPETLITHTDLDPHDRAVIGLDVNSKREVSTFQRSFEAGIKVIHAYTENDPGE